jgi:hypothetical protein
MNWRWVGSVLVGQRLTYRQDGINVAVTLTLLGSKSKEACFQGSRKDRGM